MRILEKFRVYRSKKLNNVGEFLFKLGISANLMTFFSFIAGLLAVYLLFNNYIYFFLFAILHLVSDGLDGIIARTSKTSTFGKYFDFFTDNFIAVLMLIKVGWFLNDYFVYLVTGVYAIEMIIHFLSGLKAPALFIRTGSLIIIIIATNIYFPYLKETLVIGYLTAGTVSIYSLARQLQWWIRKNINSIN